jgi:hypothetical protein
LVQIAIFASTSFHSTLEVVSPWQHILSWLSRIVTHCHTCQNYYMSSHLSYRVKSVILHYRSNVLSQLSNKVTVVTFSLIGKTLSYMSPLSHMPPLSHSSSLHSCHTMSLLSHNVTPVILLNVIECHSSHSRLPLIFT